MSPSIGHPAQRAALLALLPLVGSAGCSLLDSDQPVTQASLLQAARPAENSATLDLYWVRLPEEADASLWDHVHEDRLAVDLRRRLAKSGLRAGVVGASPPDELLSLIDPEGRGDPAASGAAALRDTGVRRRTRQLRPGGKIELHASEVIDQTPLLLVGEAGLTGRTYQQAQGVYVLQINRSGDDRVVVSLLPEVRYGQQRLRFATDETGAMSRGSLSRDRDTFADLAVSAPLESGEMLLVTSLPGAGGRLGGLMHDPPDDSGEGRKAILVRLAAAPQTRAFAPAED